jgi:hypothetical protein
MSFSKTNISRALALIAVLAPAYARAQDPEAAALFSAAKDLAAKGQWSEACPKFEAAERKEPALGTLMNLADCHEHTQLIARAWGEWRLAYEQAKKARDDSRADLAKRRAEGLEPRLPRLKVNVGGMQSDLSVWRDDKQLESAEYNTELPIDLGTRTITVRRGSDVVATKTVDMKEKAHETVAFDLDAIAKDHPAPAQTSAGSKSGDGRVVQTNTVVVNGGQQSAPTPALKVAGNIFLGVGLTAIVTGGAFEGIAFALKSGTKCVASPMDATLQLCSPSGVSSLGTAATLADAGLGVMIGGAVFVATAIVFYILSPKQKEAPPAIQTGLVPIPGGSAFMIRGSF